MIHIRLLILSAILAFRTVSIIGLEPAAVIVSKTQDQGGIDISKNKADNGVIELTSRNFDSYIADGNVWLVEFYAPWCGHCKRFAPTYEQVAIRLHNQHGSTNRKVMVGRVNGATEKALTSRFSITKYPSFYLIDGWTVREYEGNRSLDTLIDFATKSYQKYEPISFLESPFGPIGQLKAIMMRVGTKVLETHEILVKRGFSSTFAAMLMASIGIVIGLFSIIFIGLMTVQKPKSD